LAGNNYHDDDEPIAAINIVPFVDIILVVLIIFMVTTPIIMKPSINVNLPKSSSGDKTEASKLAISIDKSGAIKLNGQPTNNEELSAYAKNILNEKPDIQAVISADKDISHGDVVGVIDTIKSAGIKKFAITIDKK